MEIAVIVANMGGPDSLEAIESYLFNIFLDPDIIDIPLPGKLRKRFARWLAHKRTPESTEIYKQIGGKSPLLDITQQQASLLEKRLNADNAATFKVYPAMRYWHPLVEDVWRTIVQEGFQKLIVVTLYPFYSTATTGSLIKLVERLNANKDFEEDDLLIIDRFGNHPAFIRAMVEQIKGALSDNHEIQYNDILLSAHSIPMRRIKRGDPYRKEIERVIETIRSQLPDNLQVHHSYQSKIGPVKWLGPATPEKIDELAGKGVKNLLVYPLGFVADNSETVYEMDLLYKKQAKEKGIDGFNRIEALNTNDLFIGSLKEVILGKIDKYF